MDVALGSLTPLKRMHIGTEAVLARDYSRLQEVGVPEVDKLLADIFALDPRRSFILYKFLVDMEANLAEVRRVLAPGGRYVVAIGSNRIRGNLVESWRSKPIPEGPVVLRKALPEEVKATMTQLVDELHEKDADCAYGVAAGERLGFDPIAHDAYVSIVEARKAKSN